MQGLDPDILSGDSYLHILSEGPIFAYQQVRKPISIKLRREKKVKRPYNAFLKCVIRRKRRYGAKWKGVITPFMHKKGVILERRNNKKRKGVTTAFRNA